MPIRRRRADRRGPRVVAESGVAGIGLRLSSWACGRRRRLRHLLIGSDLGLLEPLAVHGPNSPVPNRRYRHRFVGTEKRERQKANRAKRQAEEAKAARTSAVKRNAVRWVIVAIAAVAAVVLIAWIGGAFDSSESDVPTTTTPIETLAPATTVAESTPATSSAPAATTPPAATTTAP
jgi:hypothetical protein